MDCGSKVETVLLEFTESVQILGPAPPSSLLCHGFCREALPGDRPFCLHSLAYRVMGRRPPSFVALDVGRIYDAVIQIPTYGSQSLPLECYPIDMLDGVT